MPYIKPDDRPRFSKMLSELEACGEISSGDANYIITKICHYYVYRKGERYTNHNDIVGALENVKDEVKGIVECAKLELYRRRTAPYEDKKIQENGDV